MERPLYLSFTLRGLPYSCQALPVPLCRTVAVRTGSGLFVSSLLPVGVVHGAERGMCVDMGERDNTHCCLQVTRKELVETFALEHTHTHTSRVGEDTDAATPDT